MTTENKSSRRLLYRTSKKQPMSSTTLHHLVKFAILGLLAATASAHAAPVAQWKFLQSPGSLGSDPRDTAKPGGAPHARAQLFQAKDGGYTFRIQGAATDECFAREIAATVTKTSVATIIEPTPRFVACPRIRLVINNDGTGGNVEVNMGKRGVDAWVVDEDHQYDLKPL